MANYSGIYTVRLDAVAVTIAKTLVQVNSPATRAIEILRVALDFNSTVSTVLEVRMKTSSTAGTSTAFTPVRLSGAPTALAAGAVNHTVEGTLATTFFRNYVNYLNGLLYLPVPEERILVPPSGFFGLDLPTAPGASITVNASITYGEIG